MGRRAAPARLVRRTVDDSEVDFKGSAAQSKDRAMLVGLKEVMARLIGRSEICTADQPVL
jgi:hypothetical protein